MKKDLTHEDIIWKRIRKYSFLEKWQLSRSQLINRLEEIEDELSSAITELIISTWSDSGKCTTESRERTINFLKNEGYVKDTED